MGPEAEELPLQTPGFWPVKEHLNPKEGGWRQFPFHTVCLPFPFGFPFLPPGFPPPPTLLLTPLLSPACLCLLQLMPETLFLTVNLIDRFLEKKQVTRKNLQLVRRGGVSVRSKSLQQGRNDRRYMGCGQEREGAGHSQGPPAGGETVFVCAARTCGGGGERAQASLSVVVLAL